MFFFGNPVKNREEAMKAGLDFVVVKRPLHFKAVPQEGAGDSPFVPFVMNGLAWHANVRTDDGSILGLVSDEYSILQNSEVLDFMEEVTGVEGVEWEAAGAIRHGARCFAAAKAGKVEDGIDLFLCSSNSFDKRSRVGYTFMLGNAHGKFNVCGLKEKSSHGFIHMGNLVAKHQQAAHAFGYAEQYAEAVRRKLAELESKPIDVSKFAKELFKESESKAAETKAAQNREILTSYVSEPNGKGCMLAAARYFGDSDLESRLESLLDDQATFLKKAQEIIEKL